MTYLIAWWHSPKLVKSEFDKVSSIPTHEAHKKVETSFENKVIFASTFNPRCPNVSQIINRYLHLLRIHHFSLTSSQMGQYLLLINVVKTSKIY